jgi:hypothetical protein
MNCCRETTKMGVQPGNRRVLVSVPEWYVAGADTRGRQEGRPYPWSQQVIHEISELNLLTGLIIVGWVVLNRWVLPKLGIST